MGNGRQNTTGKFLVIQTAFIGDAILATAVLEKLHEFYPAAQIDYLIRKGNEQLFENHPFIKNLLIWDKKNGKLKNQMDLIGKIRKERYDQVINCQRHFSTGLFTVLSGAKLTIGFDKNPLSFLFSKKVKHLFDGRHETQRNQELIATLTDSKAAKPKLYPKPDASVQSIKLITISPSSVWFTKQFPAHKWIEFIDKIPYYMEVHLLGGPGDKAFLESIILKTQRKSGIYNRAGELTLLQSAALMHEAQMNYVNDSAPMHLCSSVNAPVCAVYCSTVPEFGYGPLSDKSYIVQTDEKLDCKPCGIHGYVACPVGHFKCAETIGVEKLLLLIK